MIKLIPAVKTLEINSGFLKKNAVFFENLAIDERVIAALSTLPIDKNGAAVDITIEGEKGEDYDLTVTEETITIKASGPAGAFYAIQTIKQLFKNGRVPCLHINDQPDFELRGFYHDITRGRVPTIDKLKWLIDQMAYYKLNHLELYVEHTYEFEEAKDLIESTGYITAKELKELDAYCKKNFIEFVPSIATFGHLYEILQQDKYRHLAVLNGFKPIPNFWYARADHHTIDPLNPDSIEFIKSLINQYYSNFESPLFNICCDETFDLERKYGNTHDVGRLYVDFVKLIIDHLHTIGRTPMMWADILLKHPEVIDELPEDTIFLNWDYSRTPGIQGMIKIRDLNRKQVVCPGTVSWSKFCEDITEAERNISLMAEYGKKYGAMGVLNTNWGDWGNPCSIELAMYGLVLGAAKSWTVLTKINEDYYDAVDFLLYGATNAVATIKRIACMHHKVSWNNMCFAYCKYRHNLQYEYKPVILEQNYEDVKERYLSLKATLEASKWENDEYRRQMLLAIDGIMLLAELYCKIRDFGFERIIDTEKFLKDYRVAWLESSKESELSKIEEMLRYCEYN